MDFRKELTKKIKKSDDMQKAIAYYDRGMITFSECLKMLYEVDHEETLKQYKKMEA